MSTELAIRLDNLTKSFGGHKIQAVKNIDLEVPAGRVFGFLGPNGAGKTTTIRMILDLVRPSAGNVYLFGQHVQRERSVLRRVGAQVEGANFYPFLTGRRNLEVLALTGNVELKRSEIDELLDQVGMLDYAERPAHGYSTGMKQRLGLAATLLGNPDLVILDEPTNGLDPQGIQDIRLFIRRLADEQGKTIFLSSHLLGEVEQVCDRVAIINFGEVVRKGSVAELVDSETRLRVRAEPLERAQALLAAHWQVSSVNGSLLLEASAETAPEVVEKLVNEGLKVYEVSVQRMSLEAYFIKATTENDTASKPR
jgi:ABC-2 type transport system ATP-binding protein